MTPKLRKFVLTTPIVSTVGWLGATAAFLAVAIAAVSSRDELLSGADMNRALAKRAFRCAFANSGGSL